VKKNKRKTHRSREMKKKLPSAWRQDRSNARLYAGSVEQRPSFADHRTPPRNRPRIHYSIYIAQSTLVPRRLLVHSIALQLNKPHTSYPYSPRPLARSRPAVSPAPPPPPPLPISLPWPPALPRSLWSWTLSTLLCCPRLAAQVPSRPPILLSNPSHFQWTEETTCGPAVTSMLAQSPLLWP
jgi:hypothetical protein